ncbi:MAG: hypothetical protein AB8F94_14590 [Saprospiraceae bacterium]
MKKTLFSILILISLLTISSFAQKEEQEIEQSLKIYAAFQYFPSGNIPYSYFDLPNFSYSSTSLAFFRENKSNQKFFEISLSYLKKTEFGLFTETISGPMISITTTTSAKADDLKIGLRVERGRWIKKFSSEKIKIGFAPSVRLLANFSKLTPTGGGVYSRDRKQYFLTLSFVPRIQYELNSKFYLSLNFPFDILAFGIDLETIKNPVLTSSQQEQGGFDFNLGGEALIRFGVGYKF